MPGRTEEGRKRAAGSRRGTLVDSLARTPAVQQDRPNRRNPRAARPAPDSGPVATPGRLTLPSTPILSPRLDWGERDLQTLDQQAPYDDDEGGWGAGYDDAGGEDGGWDAAYETPSERIRAQSLARPLALAPARPPSPALPERNFREQPDSSLQVYAPLSQDSAPDLIAYRPPRQRMRNATQRLIQTTRDPWTRARMILALLAAIMGFMYSPLRMGEASQPLQSAQAQVGLSAGASITSQVRPETQLKRPDLYDNYGQFVEWGDAACSAAVLSEVLTAYGVPGATIGREIDELGSYISPNGGLLDRHGFVVVAARHGLRADESHSWTYNQMLYVSEHLGIPIIVNVRMTYGYYSFFSGGHFLVVVGGDSQGLAIVDSSEYYIHYLPKDVFYQMFTGYTAAIVPGDDQYTLPSN
jgi:hypothetical protein